GLTPVDLIYLDEDNRVIQAIESFPNHAIEPTREQPASALILAGHTIFSTQTQPGDMLLVCIADEMEDRLARSSSGAGLNVATTSGSAEARSSLAVVAEPSSGMDQAPELQAAQQRLAEKDGIEESVQNASWFI